MHTDTRDDLILRVARAAVRDHAVRDPLTDYWGYDGPDWLIDRLLLLRENRENGRRYAQQKRRTVQDVVSDAEVLGCARDANHGGGLRDYAEEIVIRVRYAETWGADYAVAPSLPALCWAD